MSMPLSPGSTLNHGLFIWAILGLSTGSGCIGHLLNVWRRNEKLFRRVLELTSFEADAGITLMRCTALPLGLRSCAWGLGGGICFPPLTSGGHWWKRFFSYGVLSLLKPPVTRKEEGSIQEKWIHLSSVIWLGSVSSCFSKWNKKVVFSLSLSFFFFCCAMQCNLRSLTRDWTRAPCTGNSES